MNTRLKVLSILALAVVLGGMLCLTTDFFGMADRDRVSESGDSSDADQKRGKRVRRKKLTKSEARKEWRENREKPVIEIDDRDERLTAMEKKLMKILQKAIDDDDFNAVVGAIAQIKKHAIEKAGIDADGGGAGGVDWLSHVPKSIKQAAVSSLSWFGPDALLDLMDFMMDPDVDIAQDATTQFELALQDATLADYERAEVIKRVCSVITDSDTLDSLLLAAIDARHSVGVDTLTFIAENGTDAAKEMMPEYVELFTGDEDVATTGDLQRWLAENPDEPDDEDFYGPMQLDD